MINTVNPVLSGHSIFTMENGRKARVAAQTKVDNFGHFTMNGSKCYTELRVDKK